MDIHIPLPPLIYVIPAVTFVLGWVGGLMVGKSRWTLIGWIWKMRGVR